jgi:serine/threonine-protein kinase
MSMVEMSAEDFARRAFDHNLLDQRQLESVWAELGTRNVSAADLQRVLVRRGLLTNYQVDKLSQGDKSGFFYGDYKVLYLVGTGTFARVYRAVHRETGKVVAVKVLRKRFSEDAVKTELFVREGQMGAKLRHPNIVPIYEVHSSRRMH